MQVALSMAIGNVELMNECFPKHLFMGTKKNEIKKKDAKEESRKRRVNMERNKKGTKEKEVPSAKL